MAFQFKRFQSRILFFVIGLLMIAQGVAFWAVNSASRQNAKKTINANLEATAHTFRKTLTTRGQELLSKVRLLSSDYAFKQAFASGDHGTILSALENHQDRVGADLLILLSMDEEVLCDTLHPERFGYDFENTDLIDAVMESESGETESVTIIDGTVYQVVVVPLFTPEPSALIVIGFIMDNAFAKDLGKTTDSMDVSLLNVLPDGSWDLFATTLENQMALQLPGLLPGFDDLKQSSDTLQISGKPYIFLCVRFEKQGLDAVALLLGSLDERLTAYRQLRQMLLIIFLLAILGSIVGAILISKSVVRPVIELEAGAQRIAAGDLGHRIEVVQQDELGQLAVTFNTMSQGLEERDKVRNLLGKVVSPEIAEVLISRDIELGGEERETTVLFSDIRSFTTICENQSPNQIVNMLNTYLTGMNTVIEQHKGVVDKYIGDAVMALFGAPLDDSNAASNAVGASLAMLDALGELNTDFSQKGIPELNIGIGIHTDLVLAGNMGSQSRLNYTVIGDGVNLASRIEGLSKYYGAEIIISETTKKQAEEYQYLELDRVKVKGKTRPVTIYQPLALKGELSASQTLDIHSFHEALHAYRHREWQRAAAILTEFSKKRPMKRISEIYLQRIESLRTAPPSPAWDGVFVHHNK